MPMAHLAELVMPALSMRAPPNAFLNAALIVFLGISCAVTAYLLSSL